MQATTGLAAADKSDYPEAKRQLVQALDVGGAPRGANTKVFASVGAGATTLSLVETLDAEWSVLSLCVSPDTREEADVAEAEEATLEELRRLCDESGAQLRVLSTVEASLAATRADLGLTSPGGAAPWLFVGSVVPTGGVASWYDSGVRLSEVGGGAAGKARDEAEAAAGAEEEAEAAGAEGASGPMAAAVHEAIMTRRTVNSFSPQLPDGWSDALRRAVEAATFAPNHKRTEPWRFHLLGPRAIRRVCELNAEIVSAKKGAEAGAKKLERWLAMPGWLVVTCARSEMSMDEPAGASREDYAACCCAVQNLCLALHAEGIGTKWTTGPVNFDPRFAQAAGLSADEYVVGTIWFGEAAGGLPSPPKKRPVDDVLLTHD